MRPGVRGKKVVGWSIIALIWLCSIGWSCFEEHKEHQEMVTNIAKWDTYGAIPLVSAVAENRDIYDFDSSMVGNELVHTLFYRSANAETELEAYKEYLLAQGYTDVTPIEKDVTLVAVYQKSDSKKKDAPMRVAISWINDGYKLQLSGF